MKENMSRRSRKWGGDGYIKPKCIVNYYERNIAHFYQNRNKIMYTNNMRKQLCYAQVENERGTRITLYQNVQYRTHRKFHKSNLLSVLDFYATFGLKFSQNIKGYCFNIPACNCACTQKIHVLVIYLMIGHLLWELHLPGIPYQMMLLLLKLWGVLRGPSVVPCMNFFLISFSLLC